MYHVVLYDVNRTDEHYSAAVKDDNDLRFLAALPKHWPSNKERLERLQEMVDKANRKVNEYSPIEVAIALSLYGYNVSAEERARKIYEHFDGYCPDFDELICYMMDYGCAATALPFPSAEVYVEHALEKYGEEAKNRVRIERGTIPLMRF